jgi:hypothetical protein
MHRILHNMKSQNAAWLLVLGLVCGNCFACPAADSEFLVRHCADCHAGGASEGGFSLDTLDDDLQRPAAFERWQRIHDRVAAGEMPPSDADQPDRETRNEFLGKLAARLTRVHAAQKGTVLRRLNRQEYENTINDLFGTHLNLVATLPEEVRSHEFDNVGAALGISSIQLQRYLEGARAAIDASIVRTIGAPRSEVVRASYADTRGAEQWLNKIWLHRDDGAVVFFKRYGYPSGMLREANARQSGWYHVRVTGYAFQSEAPITFALGATTFARGAERPTFGYFALPPGEPTTIECRVWLDERYMIEITPWGISDSDNSIRQNGVLDYEGPGLAVQYVELEGPLVEEFPSRGHRLLFDGLERREVLPGNPAQREKSWYKPTFEIESRGLEQRVEVALTRIVERAYRRPVSRADVEPFLRLFHDELEQSATAESALLTAVTAVLSSPGFLYFQETPSKSVSDVTRQTGPGDDSLFNTPLDDFAVASRLSYFLTRTAPDDELMTAAAAGRLTDDRAVLSAQADRLLRHPHASRFISDFCNAWLNLRDLEFTNPDATLFPEFDAFLQWSMQQETNAYLQKLIADDLSVTHVVRSDFAMLNNRLARHYGIPGVTGPEIRPVTLPPDSVRGGFLSQASVLKVSANGTNTSPVVRGVWVMERILGEPPQPPPPGVPVSSRISVERRRFANCLTSTATWIRAAVVIKSSTRRDSPSRASIRSEDGVSGFVVWVRASVWI